jgi:hypothetical protein
MVKATATGTMIGDVPVVAITPEASTREIAELGLMAAAVVGVGALAAYFILKPKAGDCWFYDIPCQVAKIGPAAVDAAGKLVKTVIWDTPYKAGEYTGSFFLGQTLQQGGTLTGVNALLAQSRSVIQGNKDILVSVPQTPKDYLPSNWTWEDPNGATLKCDAATGNCTGEGPTMIGLPAGMTLSEFCDGSPGSPICAGVIPAKKGVFGLGVFGL